MAARERSRSQYLESNANAAVPAKIHAPCRLHHWPCTVPGTRRMNATPLPVSKALAGQASMRCRHQTIAISSNAQVPIATRI